MNHPAKKNEAYKPTRHEQIANCCTHAVRASDYSINSPANDVNLASNVSTHDILLAC
jgi:hypothetical protein